MDKLLLCFSAWTELKPQEEYHRKYGKIHISKEGRKAVLKKVQDSDFVYDNLKSQKSNKKKDPALKAMEKAAQSQKDKDLVETSKAAKGNGAKTKVNNNFMIFLFLNFALIVTKS